MTRRHLPLDEAGGHQPGQYWQVLDLRADRLFHHECWHDEGEAS